MKRHPYVLLVFCLFVVVDAVAVDKPEMETAAQRDEIYLAPPQIIKNPFVTRKYATETRAFTGISSLAVSPEGRLWATCLYDGLWALPASMWEMAEGSAQMVVSNDRGKNLKIRGAATIPRPVRHYDEHMLVERKDGSLWMLEVYQK